MVDQLENMQILYIVQQDTATKINQLSKKKYTFQMYKEIGKK